jgi:hypothetical protein
VRLLFALDLQAVLYSSQKAISLLEIARFIARQQLEFC